MKKRLIYLARLVFGLGLLACLIIFRTDPAAIWSVLRHSSLALAGLAFSFHAIGLLISALRWQLLLNDSGERYSLFQLVKLYLVGIFFNHFLPTRFGGDLVRVIDTRDNSQGIGHSLAVVAYERLSGILVLMLFALCSALSHLRLLAEVPWLFLLLLIGLAGILISAIIWPRLPIERILRWPILNRANLAEKIRTCHRSLAGILQKRRLQQRVLLWALLLQLNVVIHYYFIGRTLHMERIPLTDYFFTIPILLFILSIPVSINGIGVRDWVLLKLFHPYGYDASYAVGFSLLDVFFNLLLGIIGGLIYLGRKK